MAKAETNIEPVEEVVAKKSWGVTLEPYQVIVRPLVTEKNVHKAERLNRYAFEISTLATKTDVKRAVEELFHVRVLKVATQSRKGKHRRYRARMGETKAWKKAIVSLHPDNRIDFF